MGCVRACAGIAGRMSTEVKAKRRERDRLRSQRKYAEQPEIQKACVRASYARNRETILAKLHLIRQTPEWKAKKRAADRKAYFANINARKDYHFNRRYGISLKEYEALVASQDGRCAICRCIPTGRAKKSSTLHVDHIHGANIVRGLLCNSCNRAIGLLGDSAVRVWRAAHYLATHEAKMRPSVA